MGKLEAESVKEKKLEMERAAVEKKFTIDMAMQAECALQLRKKLEADRVEAKKLLDKECAQKKIQWEQQMAQLELKKAQDKENLEEQKAQLEKAQIEAERTQMDTKAKLAELKK